MLTIRHGTAALSRAEVAGGNVRVDSENALQGFVSYWKRRPGIADNPAGNVDCQAAVTYKSGELDTTETTRLFVFIGGYEGSKLAMLPKRELNSDNAHLEFRVDWQVFELDDGTGVLTISGHSRRFGSDYRVTITPLPTD